MVKVAQQNVDVLVNGKPVKIHAHNGKLFVEAKEGSEYSIKLRNDSYSRVLAVASVDGLNIISGEIATADGAGYIINGRGSYEVKGFRVSDDKVNAFAFGKKEQSYAAKSEETGGDTRDCGVIGVKFYSEKTSDPVFRITKDPSYPKTRPLPFPPQEPWRPIGPSHPEKFPPTYPTWPNIICMEAERNRGIPMSAMGGTEKLMSTFSQTSVMRASSLDFDMGTVFTEKEIQDKVETIEFERGAELEFSEIYYASREVLEAMGISFDKKPKVSFPSSFKPAGYCKLPKRE